MISFIIPTIGRASLEWTLASIETFEGDEILVIGGPASSVAHDARVRHLPCATGGDWGATERQMGIAAARGQYLAFIDDDDTYAPDARIRMAEAILATPHRPVLFRMRYPNGFVLWREPVLRVANVSTQMMLIPNDRSRLGTWSTRREGDYDFLASMRWPESEIVWRTDVIACLGHNEVYA